jgi:hypothetical protein
LKVKNKIIFRINTKQVASNVALRRQVFESKANIDSSWRCSSDEKIKDDKKIKQLPVKARSLSVESMKENEKIFCAGRKERPKPVRENSYLTAVQSSSDVSPVILRHKLQQTESRTIDDDEERKTRRTSYLKATANEEFTSDTDQNSISMTPEEDETQQQLKV